ncbi:MAG: SgcJ/EcaC family oxidoreductase [Rhizobacter sp.]
MSTTPSSQDAAIRQTIDRWLKAVQSRDLKGVTANHTQDVVMFDVPLPVVLRGLDAYRDTWPPFFDWQRQGEGTFEIVSLDVTADERVAFATAVLRCGSKEELSRDNTPKLRLTIGLRKERDQWLIAHEHHSFPVEPAA